MDESHDAREMPPWLSPLPECAPRALRCFGEHFLYCLTLDTDVFFLLLGCGFHLGARNALDLSDDSLEGLVDGMKISLHSGLPEGTRLERPFGDGNVVAESVHPCGLLVLLEV